MLRPILALFLLLSLSVPARAETADVALLPGWRDGAHHIAGLRIRLQPGWKTYWRSPGDAGIPPSFDFSGSGNIATVRVAWPTPRVFDQGGMRSVGYGDGVVLPLVITPRDAASPIMLKVRMDIGVCDDICVPVSASLRGTLTPGAARPDARLRHALADRPERGGGALGCAFDPSGDAVAITVQIAAPAMGGAEHAVIEMADPTLWISTPQLVRRGNQITLRADIHPARGRSVGIDREGVRLTLLGQRGAVEWFGCD